MTEDKFWRIIIGTIILGLVSVFAPQIMKWLRRIGYTGWK